MPPASFFAKLGLFIREDFLEPEECARLRAEMRGAPSSAAKVGMYGSSDSAVKPNKRKTKLIEVSEETRASIVARFLDIKPLIEGHVGLPLGAELETPKFLIYETGDFFEAHSDRRDDDVAPRIARLRRVNMVLFLNGQSETPTTETFAGGSLTLYGLLDKPVWRDYGLRVTATPGLLVAFPSTLIHEVPTIVHGERYTIVSRFLDPDPVQQGASLVGAGHAGTTS
jgi:SM-20-related protein